MQGLLAIERQSGSEESIPIGSHHAAVQQDNHASRFPVSAFQQTGLQDVLSVQGAHGALLHHVLAARRPVLWVQDAMARIEFGRLSLPRVISRHVILLACVGNARDALWAMEEGVKAGLDVVGEVTGTPKILDFTATRRLELFSRAAGVRCFLVRMGPQADTGGSSGAHWRWRIGAAASEVDSHDRRAPGQSRWQLDLLRARTRPPGAWLVQIKGGGASHVETASHRLGVVSPLAAGDVDPGDATHAQAAADNVIALRTAGGSARTAVG